MWPLSMPVRWMLSSHQSHREETDECLWTEDKSRKKSAPAPENTLGSKDPHSLQVSNQCLPLGERKSPERETGSTSAGLPFLLRERTSIRQNMGEVLPLASSREGACGSVVHAGPLNGQEHMAPTRTFAKEFPGCIKTTDSPPPQANELFLEGESWPGTNIQTGLEQPFAERVARPGSGVLAMEQEPWLRASISAAEQESLAQPFTEGKGWPGAATGQEPLPTASTLAMGHELLPEPFWDGGGWPGAVTPVTGEEFWPAASTLMMGQELLPEPFWDGGGWPGAVTPVTGEEFWPAASTLMMGQELLPEPFWDGGGWPGAVTPVTGEEFLPAASTLMMGQELLPQPLWDGRDWPGVVLPPMEQGHSSSAEEKNCPA